MSAIRDYAKMDHMNSWLRHPVLGDPSFDPFERLGETVHRSEPPYEWAVNGSLFRDFDDTWYYYAGLYSFGYACKMPSRFRIYRSRDRGASWEDLGWGLDTGYVFEHNDVPSDGCPDVVLFYDEKRKKYLLTYDTSTNDFTWATAHDPYSKAEAGVALAWADSPAGPFERIPHRILTNKMAAGRCGRFSRFYATTVVPRQNDYIAFILTDSGRHFAWGLAVSTAPSAEGPWTVPHMLLSCDRPEYYPCPLEFYPAEVHDGRVSCSATSVAMNRNFQCIFEADLEAAHDPAAWKLTANGNVWHAHDHPDEHYGIWGQTYHGFIEPDTGRYVVMYPSKDARNYGTLSVAARPWNTPHTDGFTMTAHAGPSVSPLLTAYRDFTLNAEFSHKGCVDFAFAYEGTLGPNNSCADSVPSSASLSGYAAVRVQGNSCSVVSVSKDGTVHALAEAELSESASQLKMEWKGGRLSARINDTVLCSNLPIPETADKTAPLALILQKFSRIECAQFAAEGETAPYTLAFNAVDALLGAGQLMPEDEILTDPAAVIAPDVWHRIPGGYMGEGLVAAKWNVFGSSFYLPLTKSPAYGVIGAWVDGIFYGSADLCGEGETAIQIDGLSMGPHAVRVAPIKGRIAITQLITSGNAEKDYPAFPV